MGRSRSWCRQSLTRSFQIEEANSSIVREPDRGDLNISSSGWQCSETSGKGGYCGEQAGALPEDGIVALADEGLTMASDTSNGQPRHESYSCQLHC